MLNTSDHFGNAWHHTYRYAFDFLARQLHDRLADLLPDKPREERSKMIEGVTKFCTEHPERLFKEQLISHEALIAAGFQDGEKTDTRLVFLFTAVACLSESGRCVMARNESDGMLQLFDANFWFGFQNSGDLRNFVEDDAMERIFKSERASTAAKKKAELLAAERAPMVKRINELFKNRKWSLRKVAHERIGQRIFEDFPGYFPSTDKAAAYVKSVVDGIDDANKFILRKSTRKKS